MLTMLGIIIGVAAVITMVAIGTGAQRAIDEQINDLGSNLVTVIVTDNGTPPLSTTNLLTVIAKESNTPPRFGSFP